MGVAIYSGGPIRVILDGKVLKEKYIVHRQTASLPIFQCLWMKSFTDFCLCDYTPLKIYKKYEHILQANRDSSLEGEILM